MVVGQLVSWLPIPETDSRARDRPQPVLELFHFTQFFPRFPNAFLRERQWFPNHVSWHLIKCSWWKWDRIFQNAENMGKIMENLDITEQNNQYMIYPLVILHSHGKSPLRVNIPNKDGDFP